MARARRAAEGTFPPLRFYLTGFSGKDEPKAARMFAHVAAAWPWLPPTELA
eukprot:gene9153-4413_t